MKYQYGTCHSADLSATNPIVTALESHQGLGGEGLATDRCRHDAFIVTGCSCDVTALVSVKYIVANTLHVVSSRVIFMGKHTATCELAGPRIICSSFYYYYYYYYYYLLTYLLTYLQQLGFHPVAVVLQ
jgi:hypothetical protein